MTVKDIVIEYLKVRGFDGLCNPDAGCGCGEGDFCPCSEDWSECEPAYKTFAKEEGDNYGIGDEIFTTVKP